MTVVQKWFTGLTAIAVIATLTLPGRQTPQVIKAFTGLIREPLATAMGTGKKV